MSSGRSSDAVIVRRGQQVRALEKKRLILDAAAQLMQEDGLRGVTHRQVAALAGVPVGSIGYYYNNREELVSTAIARINERRHKRVLQLLGDVTAPMSPEATADLLLGVILGYPATADRLSSWLTTALDCARESEELHDSLSGSREQLRADLAEALEASGFAMFCPDSITVTVAGAVALCMVSRDSDCVEMVRGNLIELLRRRGD